jgi:acetoin utilization deacetylase AcuC-like enzyme
MNITCHKTNNFFLRFSPHFRYRAVWSNLLLPIARSFKPGLILVSAGFDAASGDMGECSVTPKCFASLTRDLMALQSAKGRVVMTLEGGYVRSVLAKCVASCLGALMGEKGEDDDEVDEDDLEGDEDALDYIDTSAKASILATISAHSEYWDFEEK